MTDFRSSEFNNQKLNKSTIQQSGQFKESYHKNISKTNIYIFVSPFYLKLEKNAEFFL